MRVIIQRVDYAKVRFPDHKERSIEKGLLILAGIEEADNETDADWLAAKIINLRIFNDQDGVMNLSVQEIGGQIMIISQFTLFAKTKKGNRPSYIRAATPEKAIPLYNYFVETIQKQTFKKIVTGEFGAHMEISLLNNGPVTIIIDTKNKE
ncbi:MAG: D-tyrosyl-tRNA(Tyr) deacylase [Bacteroidales bacterium]|nr:D-tyrosyl-tRNA(Tyr) deacylase [Bacteroidales bacterium]